MFAHDKSRECKSELYANWVIGLYILEYEQGGTDRLQYGSPSFRVFGVLHKELDRCLYRPLFAFMPAVPYRHIPRFESLISESGIQIGQNRRFPDHRYLRATR